MSVIKVCVGGVTGWTGSELVKGILADKALQLVSGVSRKLAAAPGYLLDEKQEQIKVFASVQQAFDEGTKPDVYVDYTHPSSVKQHAAEALSRGINVIVGTSGLSAQDYADLEKIAQEKGVGIFGAGNYSITAALLKHFSVLAAQYVNQYEIFDYASAKKPDVPSGTARELAEAMAAVQKPFILKPVEDLLGPKEARGADVSGVRVHSLRLPSFILSAETLFGMDDERLTIRHDAGTSAKPYVAGTLLAIKKVIAIKGLQRGMDTLLFPQK